MKHDRLDSARFRRGGTSRRGGFTLLEIIIVVVILGIIAAMVVPRISGTTKRTFDLSVDQVSDLLVMYAQRDQLARYPVGLTYDPDAGRLGLRVLTPPVDDVTAPPSWRSDVFVSDIKLPPVVDFDSVTVYADGEIADVRTWPLANTPGQPRPLIEIYLRSIDEEHEATLRLTPHGVAPARASDAYSSPRESIDLDAVGRSQEDW